jgi:hypothetical protein
VHDLVNKLSKTTSIDEVAEIVCAVGALTLGAERVGMWIVDGQCARAVGKDVNTVTLQPESHPIAHVIHSRRARWLRPEQMLADTADRIRAASIVPLVVEDRAIGALAFTFTNEHLLQVEERELVFELAVAIAVHAARAIERLVAPVRAPRSWPSGTRPFVTAPSARRRILIVGEQSEADAFARALDELGHETVVVYSGIAAMRVSAEWPADVAFVDVDSSNSDATGIAGKLHGGQLVALTSHRARVPGFTAHVLKPFVLDTVVELLDSFDRN